MRFFKLSTANQSAVILMLGLAQALAHAEDFKPNFEGGYVEAGLSYVHPQNQYSLNVSRAGVTIPSSLSYSTPDGFGAAFKLGYNWNMGSDYLIGLGLVLSPYGNKTPSFNLALPSLNKSLSVNGSKALYDYGLFTMFGMKIDPDRLFYAKLGYQTLVPDDSAFSNFTGYLAGVGYKQFVLPSFYVFGELNFTSYQSQGKTNTTSVSVGSNTVSINIASITQPKVTHALVGLGYQF
jgi:hypothetical protein